MKRYVMVFEIKPEHVKDYVEIHKNTHLSHWKTQLHACKEAGAEDLRVYIYKNYSIMFIECEDLDQFFVNLGKNRDAQQWSTITGPWFATTTKLDGSEKSQYLEKIWDLREQLEGKLTEF